MYEVQNERLADVAALVKHEMERAIPLRVPTPVKLSVGPSWGELKGNIELERLREGLL